MDFVEGVSAVSEAVSVTDMNKLVATWLRPMEVLISPMEKAWPAVKHDARRMASLIVILMLWSFVFS